MERPKIAIIGAGISGLSVAYFLAPHANVTVFEKEGRLGGHANTARISVRGTSIDVDTGFMVYNPIRYPYLVALFRELAIPSVSTVMSFSVSIPHEVEYSSIPKGLFGNLSQSIRPSYMAFLIEIVRFNRLAKRFLNESLSAKDMTLGEFIKKHGLSAKFTEWYLYPMMGSIWSTTASIMAEYPAYESFRFLDNHLLLSVLGQPEWRTVKGGSRVYVGALEKLLESEGVVFKRNAVISSIRRNVRGVSVRHTDEEVFDRVVFATHADVTLALISDATQGERAALSLFRYSKNRAVLHGDTAYMPQRRSAWASWNYHGHNDVQRVSLTYNMNALQHIPENTPVFVTLNPNSKPKNELVYGEYEYDHPIFDANARKAQDMVEKLQGTNHTYYAGAHLGYGFHEDGIASAARVVLAIGYPLRLSV